MTTTQANTISFPADALAKAKNIKLAVFDVDGVFTDGHLYFTPDGAETKVFHARDGWGVKALMNAGIEVAIISGRSAPVVTKRMESLGVKHIFQGNDDKLPIFQKLISELGVQPQETAYMGDDVPDIAILEVCGLPISVADGHHSVLPHACYVTPQSGGKAAVRNACELILAGQA